MLLLVFTLSLVSGQVSADDEGVITVTIISPSVSILVTSPNGGENWVIGSTHAITWSSVSVTGRVRIELSRDSGATWTTIIRSAANDGSQNWRVTGPATSRARIRVSSTTNHDISDTGDADFTIAPSPVWIKITSPNGGENWEIGSRQTITWDSLNVPLLVRVELSRDGGNTWETIRYLAWNDGSQSWRVTGPATSHARIRVTAFFYPAVFDISDADFTITQPKPSTTVTSPNGGESWRIGTSKTVTWTSRYFNGLVKIELSRDGGVTWTTIANYLLNDGSYRWRVSGPSTTQARIKVSGASTSTLSDISDADFTIR